MPLKIASLVCAVLALFLLVYDVGLNLYDMVTYEYFSIGFRLGIGRVFYGVL
jgi:hypothetical protein